MIEPFKINLPIVAAFLTIIGYSVNDTIVVFDRIREVRGKDPRMTRQMVNDSTNQTLSRTLLTSFTVMLVVVILYIFGGEAIHGFAFALMIGVLTGTYSSIYVAAPILLWLIHPKAMRRQLGLDLVGAHGGLVAGPELGAQLGQRAGRNGRPGGPGRANRPTRSGRSRPAR